MGIAKDLYRSVLRALPEKPALYLIYFRGYQKILNLKNPQYFGEKIQWLKLYGHLDELSDYVDKYAVREFVAKTVGDKYLNQLYGVYNNPDEIDYENHEAIGRTYKDAYQIDGIVSFTYENKITTRTIFNIRLG